jgi:hypothetical protein
VTTAGRLLEAVAVAAAGGALGAAAGSPLDLAILTGAVGAANGFVSGWRGTYDWSCSSGGVGFVLDSTWALVTTTGSVLVHGINAVAGGRYHEGTSRRRNRHVYAGGFRPRRGFVITVGNVITGVGDPSSARTARLVADHEGVHVWQARWFGPLYVPLYVGWMALGAIAGLGVWLLRGRRDPVGKVVETCAYYLNPFEWWAYSRDDSWPPRGKVSGLGWRRPAVRAFAGSRAAPR